MPLLNDMARCQGRKKMSRDTDLICGSRQSCARYVERLDGGPRTMAYAYLCSDGDDRYIPAEKPNDH